MDAQQPHDWTAYLPAVLQTSTVYWTLGVCWAIIYLLRVPGLPPGLKLELFVRWAVIFAGVVTDIILIPTSKVYAVGSGIILAALAMISYDLVLKTVENRIIAAVRFFTGNPPSEPLSYDPTKNPTMKENNP